MLIAIFTWQIVGDYFLNIVSLWELNGLKLGKKQYIVAIYQTDIRYISVQEWKRSDALERHPRRGLFLRSKLHPAFCPCLPRTRLFGTRPQSCHR